MPNSIATRQNEQKFIDRLSAYSQVYKRALLLSRIQRGTALVSVAAGVAAALWFPSLKWQAAGLGIFVAVLDRGILDRAVQRYRELGARIQELFDCELLELPWRDTRAGARPDPEEIREWSDRFKRKDSVDRLLNWYPTSLSAIPLEYARLICQRSNMRWDSSLRKQYALVCDVGLWIILVGFVGVAFTRDWSFRDFALNFAPYLPAVLLLHRESDLQKQSANSTERTKSLLESFWRNAVSAAVPAKRLLEDARCLQDQLYDRRRSTPQVPPWLYFFLRDTYEQNMQAAAAGMVTELQEAGRLE